MSLSQLLGLAAKLSSPVTSLRLRLLVVTIEVVSSNPVLNITVLVVTILLQNGVNRKQKINVQ